MALGQKGTGFHNWLNARTQRVGMLDYCGHHLHAGAVCHVSVMVPCLLFDPGSGRDVDCVSPVWRTVHLNSCTVQYCPHLQVTVTSFRSSSYLPHLFDRGGD